MRGLGSSLPARVYLLVLSREYGKYSIRITWGLYSLIHNKESQSLREGSHGTEPFLCNWAYNPTYTLNDLHKSRSGDCSTARRPLISNY